MEWLAMVANWFGILVVGMTPTACCTTNPLSMDMTAPVPAQLLVNSPYKNRRALRPVVYAVPGPHTPLWMQEQAQAQIESRKYIEKTRAQKVARKVQNNIGLGGHYKHPNPSPVPVRNKVRYNTSKGPSFGATSDRGLHGTRSFDKHMSNDLSLAVKVAFCPPTRQKHYRTTKNGRILSLVEDIYCVMDGKFTPPAKDLDLTDPNVRGKLRLVRFGNSNDWQQQISAASPTEAAVNSLIQAHLPFARGGGEIPHTSVPAQLLQSTNPPIYTYLSPRTAKQLKRFKAISLSSSKNSRLVRTSAPQPESGGSADGGSECNRNSRSADFRMNPAFASECAYHYHPDAIPTSERRAAKSLSGQKVPSRPAPPLSQGPTMRRNDGMNWTYPANAAIDQAFASRPLIASPRVIKIPTVSELRDGAGGCIELEEKKLAVPEYLKKTAFHAAKLFKNAETNYREERGYTSIYRPFQSTVARFRIPVTKWIYPENEVPRFNEQT